jgi:hypothetical protein
VSERGELEDDAVRSWGDLRAWLAAMALALGAALAFVPTLVLAAAQAHETEMLATRTSRSSSRWCCSWS